MRFMPFAAAASLLALIATGVRGELRVEDQVLQFRDEVEVAPLDSGTIAEVLVQPGEEIAEGALLVRLDDGQAALERDAARSKLQIADADAGDESGVEIARSAENLARVEYERGRSLGTVIVASDLDRLYFDWQKSIFQTKQAENELERARLAAAIRRSELALAEQAWERRQVRAPAPGTVLEVRRSPGEWLQLGDAVVVIGDLSELRVKLHLDAGELRPEDLKGRTGEFRAELPGGVSAAAPGAVTFVRPEIQPDGTFDVWFDVRNSRVRGAWLLTPGVHGEVLLDD